MSGILFLCTGNSCRSQMAEGFGKAIFGEERSVFSAGTKPQGIHPIAIEVMREVEISIENHQSTHLDDIPLDEVSLVITLCDSAAKECPTILGKEIQHWGLPDPADALGTAAEKLDAFRQIRDEIKTRIATLAQ